jgi:chromosome segregation ATPase
VVDLQYHR